MVTEMLRFCQDIPKVELHAHLNSSFSRKTFQHLLDRKAETKPEVKDFKVYLEDGEAESLKTAFRLFKMIHQVCDDEYSIYKLTYDIIHDFAADNVKYLEIRSTPKDIPQGGLTRKSYLQTMIKAIKECEAENLDIMVKILPSIDRQRGLEVAEITVKLAKEIAQEFPGYVPGIDFSGDPQFLDGSDFIPFFKQAKADGLKLALHLSEIPNIEAETLEILKQSLPDRIGHGTYLHQFKPGEGYEEILDIVKTKQIPLEHCLTSNLKSETTESFEAHHFGYWYALKHPQVVCTDGRGVFLCELSDEYANTAKAFNLNKEELWDLSYRAIDYTFTSEMEKEKLKNEWSKLKNSCFLVKE
ncbi:hypothetical protein SNE40_017117 [Patella caerulea]|uniref:Adenosine deaminase domain-containing protein n=1 Tax=Patella caerulea TaxID=87958 RepID=A0AAN8PKW9_PATCE